MSFYDEVWKNTFLTFLFSVVTLYALLTVNIAPRKGKNHEKLLQNGITLF